MLIRLVASFLKHLKAALKLLESVETDFPALVEQLSTFKGTTKPAIAAAIVQFIHNAHQIPRLKCNQDYSATNATSEVACLMCGQLGCYADP